ncbi:MAG: hypothetical protein U5K37_08550 [Natrialbaceae archaeon]|nr:hypothetical protein [Natrialbaceae archaeon]
MEFQPSIINEGVVNETSNVTLLVNDSVVDSTTAFLRGGSHTAIADPLSWDQTNYNAGEYEVSISTDRAARNQTISVGPFNISNVSSDDTISSGDTLTVTSNITNLGDVYHEQNITLDIEGEGIVDSTNLGAIPAITSGEDAQVEFTWDSTGADIGTRNATISSETHSASTEFEIK